MYHMNFGGRKPPKEANGLLALSKRFRMRMQPPLSPLMRAADQILAIGGYLAVCLADREAINIYFCSLPSLDVDTK